MVKLSRNLFERLLFSIDKSQIVSFTALTVPKMRKTMRRRKNPYHGRVIKISRVNGIINWRYSSAVQKQLQREGKLDIFQAMPRTWGSRITGAPLVAHVALDSPVMLYLETKIEKRTSGYYDTETLEQIGTDDVEPWLKDDAPSRQGTSRTVLLKDYRLDHIAELRMGGEDYGILPCWYELQAYLPTPRPTAQPVEARA